MTVAALIAFTALTLAGGVTPVLPLLTVGLLSTYFIGARIEPLQWWVHWLLRLTLYAGIAFSIANQTNEGLVDSFLNASAMEHVGQWAAAEFVIQAWRRQPPGQTVNGSLILLSGLTLMAACQTSDEQFPRLFVPAYMLLLMLSLRRWDGREAVRWVALVVALGTGAAAYGAVWTNRASLTAWGTHYLDGRPAPETTGLSLDPTLGETFGLRGSARRVLRITGLNGITYLRAASFDTYGGGRWGPSVGIRRYSSAVLNPNAHGERAQVTPLAPTDRMLPSPLNCAGIDTDENEGVIWGPDGGGPVLVSPAQPAPYGIIQSQNAHYQGPLAAPPSPDVLTRCRAIPPDLDPRVRALAQEIGAHETSQNERIQAVRDYLMSHHQYSLSIQLRLGDPVSHFLLDTPPKGAHCEYFAASAALLLRCLGVPTRYVEGYYAHESDGPGVTVVRQRDAHAWVEAWVAGTGWVTVDATPRDGRPHEDADSVPPWQRLVERVADGAAAARAWLLGLNWSQAALGIGGAAALFLVLRAAWGRLRKTPAPRDHGASYTVEDVELAALAARFEATLARQGVPCPPGRPWREHLEAAGRTGGTAEAFVRTYNDTRFGGYAERDRTRLLELLAEAERPTMPPKGEG